jgi:small ligand-binding sensory domain FIST
MERTRTHTDTAFAAGLSEHPVPSQAVGEAVGQVLEQLGEEHPDLVVVFASGHHTGAFDDIGASIRSLLFPVALIGCSADAVIGGTKEVEDGPALAIFAARLPASILTTTHLQVVSTPDGPAVSGWPDADVGSDTLLLLADPFSFPTDAFLARANDDLPGLRVIGGLASSARGRGGNRLLLDGHVTTEGAVGVFVDGGVDVATVVSQGCRPIGQPFVVTRAEQNVIYELGGQPALQRLRETALAATDDERDMIHRGLHVGIVVDEHKLDFAAGDFLVRNVMGGDESTGAIAVGDLVEVGQTVQFHVRDADSADADLHELLELAADEGGADAALLFTCTGRGRHLFGEDDHDARLLGETLGPLPVAGFFCAGEIGPVGPRNFMHGFTASLALFRS